MTGLRTEADLAEIFDATERRISEWRRIYNWPHTRIGRTIRFTDNQLEQILASHESTAQGESPAVLLSGQTKRSARRSS